MLRFLGCLLLFLFLHPMAGLAQLAPNLQLSREVWNSRSTNPAFLQPYQVIVGLPGVANDLHLDGIRYGDIFQKDGDQLILDVDRVLENIGDRIDVRERVELNTVGVGFRLGEFQLSLGHAVLLDAQLDLPRELPELIWRGNAPFIGQTVQLDMDVQLQSYHRFQLGLAREVTEGLTLGANINWLSGINSLATERFDVDFTTDDDIYGLTLDTDIRVQSAGALEYNGLDDIRIQSPTEALTAENLFSNNTAATFDLGARYQRGKWDLAASVLNLTNAELEWNTDATTFTAPNTITYNGIDGNSAIVNGEAIQFNSAIDTLTELLGIESQTNSAFRTALPRQAYLSGIYQLNNDLELGATWAWEKYKDVTSQSAVLLGRYRVLENWKVGATYGYHDDRYDQLGLQTYATLGPVQLYAMTNDVLGLLSPDEAHRIHFQLGMNLLFQSTEVAKE